MPISCVIDVVALLPLHLVKLRAAPFPSLLQREAGFALALARLEVSGLRDLNQRFASQTADLQSLVKRGQLPQS